MRYEVAGHGKPLVLIHGLAASRSWWSRNVAALSQEHTVYLLDLPGFGSMRKYREEFVLSRAAEWVRMVIEALGIERPSVVGHSMGGAICLSFAARWPDEVDRLVLVAPAVSLPYRTLGGSILPLVNACRVLSPRFAPTLVYDALRAGPRTLARCAQDLFTARMEEQFASLRTKPLLIWGDRDSLVPVSVGRMLSGAITGSRLCVIERAGHVVMFDRPDEFNRTVLDFLDGPA